MIQQVGQYDGYNTVSTCASLSRHSAVPTPLGHCISLTPCSHSTCRSQLPPRSTGLSFPQSVASLFPNLGQINNLAWCLCFAATRTIIWIVSALFLPMPVSLCIFIFSINLWTVLVSLDQGSATFTIQRAILPYFPPNKICMEPQKLFEITAYKVLYRVILYTITIVSSIYEIIEQE